jgi:hypothetical protein
MTRSEKFKVECRHGFKYEVTLEHKPHHGFSTALHNGSIIGQVELGRIIEPISDNDREWELYEERYSEWTDEIKVNMKIICENHFNRS